MPSTKLTKRDKEFLLRLARWSITEALNGEKGLPEAPESTVLNAPSGAFVTLHLEGRLRGCIGTPLPVRPLYLAIHENALAAAFHDPRFPPLAEDELPRVDLEISVMTIPHSIDDPEEVEVGRDGIIISMGRNRGLLLPQVAVEQGWNREEFLRYGCMKAGLDPEEFKSGASIEIFQAIVFGEKSLRG